MTGKLMSEEELSKILMLLVKHDLNIPDDCPVLYAAFERFAAEKEEEWELADWAEEQKLNRWKLSPAQRAKLESIPGWTWERGGSGDHRQGS